MTTSFAISDDSADHTLKCHLTELRCRPTAGRRVVSVRETGSMARKQHLPESFPSSQVDALQDTLMANPTVERVRQ